MLEVNGAVEFTPEYSLGGANVFADTAAALAFDRPEARIADARLV